MIILTVQVVTLRHCDLQDGWRLRRLSWWRAQDWPGCHANAILTCKLTRRWSSPRAFLVVPITGTFLVDLFNATIITAFIHVLKGF